MFINVEMSLYVDFSETPPVDTFIYEVSFEQKFWSGLAQEIMRSEALKIEVICSSVPIVGVRKMWGPKVCIQ